MLRRGRRTILAATGVLLLLALVRWRANSTDLRLRLLDDEETCRSDMEVNMLPEMPSDDRDMLVALFAYITTPNKMACGKVAQFGGAPMLRTDHVPLLDGHKFSCMDSELGLASSDACLVYSVGISDDWSFDWDMEAFGCTVFAFDPTINVTSGYQNGSVVFLHYGLDQWNHVSDQGWQMRTLDTFVERLGHANRTIHYLKVDIEDSEWAVLRQQAGRGRESTLFRNVEQMGVELHFMSHMPFEDHAPFYREVYQTFLQLQQLGFYLFYYDPNLTGITLYEVPGLRMRVPSAVEVVWMKSTCPAQKFGVTRTGGLYPLR